MKTNKKNIIRLTETQFKQIVSESVKRVLVKNRVNRINEDIDDEMKVWQERDNEQFSQIIKSIDDYFSDVIAPEEDEFGIMTTPIRQLRTIYALDGDKKAIVKKLYNILTNYDMINIPNIRKSMQELEKLAASDNVKESRIKRIVSESVKRVLKEFKNETSIYDMEQWRMDGSLNPQEGQLVSNELVEELAYSVPPTTWSNNYFQPGEAYDFDPQTHEDRFMTFQSVDSDTWKYVGLKPKIGGNF